MDPPRHPLAVEGQPQSHSQELNVIRRQTLPGKRGCEGQTPERSPYADPSAAQTDQSLDGNRPISVDKQPPLSSVCLVTWRRATLPSGIRHSVAIRGYAFLTSMRRSAESGALSEYQGSCGRDNGNITSKPSETYNDTDITTEKKSSETAGQVIAEAASISSEQIALDGATEEG